MAALNLTTNEDVLLSNTSVSNNIIIEEDNWKIRLIENWIGLASYTFCSTLCALVICVTLFDKKHINNDYKWFVLNQGIANFCFAFGLLLYYAIVFVYIGQIQYLQLKKSGNISIWFKVFYEIAFNEIEQKFGANALHTTLLAAVINRWVAIVAPNYYSIIMTPRLILVYCSLCYLLFLPVDVRLFKLLSLSSTLENCLYLAPFLVPWLLSIIINISSLIFLWKRNRSLTDALRKRNAKDNSKIVYSLVVQTVVPLFSQLPQYILLFGPAMNIIIPEVINHNWFFVFLEKLSDFNYYFSSGYTCLVIFITLGPYRRALISLLSPIKKLYKRYWKLNLTKARVIPTNS